MASQQKPTDLGVLDGTEEHRDQRTSLRMELKIGGPYSYRNGEPKVTISQTALYPASFDRTFTSELSLFHAKKLRDQLDDKIERMESRQD